MQRISGYIISIALLLPVWCNAQDSTRYPINEMKGIRIGIDVSKPALYLLYHHERLGFEATADMHIKNNLFAVVETGWLRVNLDKTDFHYQENGWYGKLGVDLNQIKSRRPYSNDIVYIGVRYGFSTFSQQGEGIIVPGYFWPDGANLSIPKSIMSAHWLELMLGVKAEVLRNLYLGMTFRFKFKIVSPKDDYSTPYLIPGYGNGNQGYALGINYYLSYNFQF